MLPLADLTLRLLCLFVSVLLLSAQADASVRKAVLTDGFSALFGADLWPVTTAAMQALEVRREGVV